MLRVELVSPDGLVKDAFDMADGMTLSQAVRTLYPDDGGNFPVPTVALVGAKAAVRELGDYDVPLSGCYVQFRQLPCGGGGGGGSNAMQIVMQVAVIALAAAATWYVGGTGAIAGISALGLGSAMGGLAGAGVMVLGTLLMGALCNQTPIPQGQLGSTAAAQSSPTYSINSSGNTARLYQQEPEIFGNMRVVPDYGAKTWTYYEGNDQMGCFVYVIGRGRYQVRQLAFGETPFWRDGKLVAGTGYDVRDIQIVEPGQPVTIFPDNVVTSDEVASQELFAPNNAEYTGVVGPYVTNGPGTKTDRLLLDFVFQAGLGYHNEQGKLTAYTVRWRVEYRAIDDTGAPLSGWAVLEDCSRTEGTLTALRITRSYTVAPGRYEVRCRRLSDTRGDSGTLDKLLWGALRAILPGTRAYPVTCVALRIRANNVLSQAASNKFSAIVTRKLPLYDVETGTWSEETPTRSWAAAVSHVCRCAWGGRLADRSIDLEALWRIGVRLEQRGWHYDACIDGPYLIWPLVAEMCQSQCVIPRFVGAVLSFVEDGPGRAPSFALTPRTIVRGSFAVTYHTWADDTPDDVTLEYLDADYGFQQRDVTARLPESESREPANLSLLGITSREHAFRVATRYAAHNRWRRVSVECQVEALGRLVSRGDICTVAHPRFRDTLSGKVEAWDADRLALELRPDMAELPAFAAEAGAELYLALTRPDGTVWGPCRLAHWTAESAQFEAADYTTLMLQGHGSPFEWLTSGTQCQPTAWTLYTARQYQRLMIVEHVGSQDPLHYTLKLRNYTEQSYAYDRMAVPLWQDRGQLPQAAALTAPDCFKVRLSSTTSLILTWLSVPGAQGYDVETSTDGSAWMARGRAIVTQMTVDVPPGRAYARVRAIGETTTGPWATWQGDTTVPVPATPVLALASPYQGGEASLSWAPVPHADAYALALFAPGEATPFHVATLAADVSGFSVAPELFRGGPTRTFRATLTAQGAAGTSGEASLDVADPAPAAATAIEAEAAGDAVIFQEIVPVAADSTGFALVRGNAPDFTAAGALELRETASLPFTWAGLAPGRHYFRAAVKDAFYDATATPLELLWSAVLVVDVPAEGEAGGEGEGNGEE